MERYSVGKTYPDFMKFDLLPEEQRAMLIFFWRSVWKDFLYSPSCLYPYVLYLYLYIFSSG